MHKQRRTFLKATLGATALGVGMLVSVKTSPAAGKKDNGSNGVIIGHSPKKEVLYEKTANWESYYKATY